MIIRDHMSTFSCPTSTFFRFLSSLMRQISICFNWTAATSSTSFLQSCSTNVRDDYSIFQVEKKRVNVDNNLMASMSQTLSSWILFRVLCSEITVLSNSSCSSLVWKRMKMSYFLHIVSSSGVKSFSNGFGYSKFLSSMNSFLRFLSSSLQRFSI